MNRRLATTIAAGALLAGIVVPLGGQSAQALPPNCTIEETWHNGTSYYSEDDDTYVETGIHATRKVVCGPTTDWTPGGDPSTGGGPTTPPGAPPAPPGPTLPKPPDSVPPSVAPPCVDGANNDPTPGKSPGEPTGTGDTLLANLAKLAADGYLKIDSTGPSRFVTLDIPLSDPVGREGTNPFAGMSPEEATRAMYWENGVDPTYAEVAGGAKAVLNLVKLAVNGLKSPAARAEFYWAYRQLDAASRSDVILKIGRVAYEIEKEWKGNIPPALKGVLEDIYALLEQLINMASAEPAEKTSAALYASVSAAPKAGGRDTGNTGVCGQLQQATASAGTAPAGLSVAGDWAHVTLQGTVAGTLIAKIKALAPSPVTCPTVSIGVTAGPKERVNVTSDCEGTIVGTRVLTRQEIGGLSPMDRATLLAGSESDPFVTGALDYSPSSEFDWATPDSTSMFSNAVASMAGSSADGSLEYQAPAYRGGNNDVVVVAAMDEAGVEHPFLVKVAVKSPARCDNLTKPVGPSTPTFRAVIQDGALQLVRNVPFTLNLGSFCSTDIRDSYRVIMEKAIPGTKGTVNADGTITFTWTDPDVVSDRKDVLTLTPWDETTGAPGETVEIPVVVRDVAASCDDLEVDYDMKTLKGAPMEIPMQCGMEGGLKVLAPPFLAFNVPGPDLSTQVVDGGTFKTDGTTLTFTPSAAGAEVSTAHVVPWTVDPGTYTPYRVHGKVFDIDVRISD
ncbi:hypothetical protein VD659_02670 [Herbiconiux sp. 11R-BC]|uniref:hypothetical protein n=1 Tax=Herbiconiux sp. 11R-BC TaxID=3111637 RepID=UPI003C0EDE53